MGHSINDVPYQIQVHSKFNWNSFIWYFNHDVTRKAEFSCSVTNRYDEIFDTSSSYTAGFVESTGSLVFLYLKVPKIFAFGKSRMVIGNGLIGKFRSSCRPGL